MNKSDALMPSLDVETRWSSTCNMLESALKSKSVLADMTAECDGLQIYSIDTAEWIKIQKLCNLLYMVNEVTKNQSATSYTTLSMMRRIHEILSDAGDVFSEVESNVLSEIGSIIKSKLASYYKFIQSYLHRLSIILDPRFASE